MVLTKTDSGEFILDENILLEEGELEQLAIDFGEAENREVNKIIVEEPVVYIKDKAVRRKCFEQMEQIAQIYLADNKKGYELEKLKEPLRKKMSYFTYMETIINLCAIIARYNSLKGYKSKDKSIPVRQEVEFKIDRLVELGKELLDNIRIMEEELYGVYNGRRELIQKIMNADSRKEIKKKMKKNFVEKGEIWLV